MLNLTNSVDSDDFPHNLQSCFLHKKSNKILLKDTSTLVTPFIPSGLIQ